MPKRIWILMGPSGTGKTTLIRKLTEWGIPELCSHTTRAKRPSEEEGVDYWYISREKFLATDMVEVTEYSGNLYGLSRAEAEQKLSAFEQVCVICDVNGARQIRKQYPKETKVIFVSAPIEVIAQRMKARGDSQEVIDSRIKHALDTGEWDNLGEADFWINNMDLNQSVKTLRGIINGDNFISPSAGGSQS